MSTAISGLNTTLYCGDSATALTKLCDIKDVPDLISEPNLLDLLLQPLNFKGNCDSLRFSPRFLL